MGEKARDLIEKMKSENVNLNHKISTMEESSRVMAENHKELKREHNQVVSLKESLEKQLDESRDLIDKMKSENVDLTSKISRIEEGSREMAQSYKELKDEHNQLLSLKETLEKELEESRDLIDKMKSENLNLSIKISTIEESYCIMTQNYKELKDEHNQVVSLKEGLEKEREESTKLIDKMKSEIVDLSNKISKIVERSKEMAQSYKKLKDEHNQVVSFKESLEKELVKARDLNEK